MDRVSFGVPFQGVPERMHGQGSLPRWRGSGTIPGTVATIVTEALSRPGVHLHAGDLSAESSVPALLRACGSSDNSTAHMIFSKETKPNYARRLIWHPGQLRAQSSGRFCRYRLVRRFDPPLRSGPVQRVLLAPEAERFLCGAV